MKRYLFAVLTAALMGCSLFTIHVKPLLPHAITCGWDWDCPDNMHCGFPDVDTYLQCLPGQGERRWQTGSMH